MNEVFVMARKPIEKQVVPPVRPVQPPAQPKEIKITLPTISLRFDEHFKRRLPLLLILAVLFVFSCVVFDKANLRVLDIFDLTRISLAYSKMFSLSFILFGLLFALAMAFAMFYAHGLTPALSLAVFPVTLVPALFLWLFMPALGAVFVAFSITLSFAAFLASRERSFNWHRAWTAMRRALSILLLLAVLVTAWKVYAAQEAYANVFFTSAEVLVLQDSEFSRFLGTGNNLGVSQEDLTAALPLSSVEGALSSSETLNEMFDTVNASDYQKGLIAVQLHEYVMDEVSLKLSENQFEFSSEGGGLIAHYAKSSQLGQTITGFLPLMVIPIVWFIGTIALLVIRVIGVIAWFALSRL